MTPTTYRYTGQREQAEIGLYYYGARWYDPYLARFTQPDTIHPDPADPQQLGRYTYVRNHPLRYIDSSGHRNEPTGDARKTPPLPPPPQESRLPDLTPYEEEYGPADAPYSVEYSEAVLDTLMAVAATTQGPLTKDEMLRLVEAAQIVQTQGTNEGHIDKASSVLASYSMALEHISQCGSESDQVMARLEQASLGVSARTGDTGPVSSRAAFAPAEMWRYEYWGDYLRQEGYTSGLPGPTGLWGYFLTS